MNQSIYRISLDIHSVASQLSFSVNRGDNMRRLIITLTENGKTYEITDDCYAIFTTVKPDGTHIANDCTIQNNTIIYDFTEQTTAVAGKLDCSVVVFNTKNERITSPRFTVIVYETTHQNINLTSESEYAILTSQINASIAKIEEMDDLIETVNNERETGVYDGLGVKNIQTALRQSDEKGNLYQLDFAMTDGTIMQSSFVAPKGEIGSIEGIESTENAIKIDRPLEISIEGKEEILPTAYYLSEGSHTELIDMEKYIVNGGMYFYMQGLTNYMDGNEKQYDSNIVFIPIDGSIQVGDGYYYPSNIYLQNYGSGYSLYTDGRHISQVQVVDKVIGGNVVINPENSGYYVCSSLVDVRKYWATTSFMLSLPPKSSCSKIILEDVTYMYEPKNGQPHTRNIKVNAVLYDNGATNSYVTIPYKQGADDGSGYDVDVNVQMDYSDERGFTYDNGNIDETSNEYICLSTSIFRFKIV